MKRYYNAIRITFYFYGWKLSFIECILFFTIYFSFSFYYLPAFAMLLILKEKHTKKANLIN